MKALIAVIGCLIAVAFLISFLNGCKGPAGPVGPAGTAECGGCHNDSTAVLSRMLQYAASVHATGGHYNRNTNGCAPCHTNEGFVEVLATGADTTATTVSNPTPPSCRTCHNIHATFSWSDFSLRTESPVVFRINGETFNMGEGNLCAHCHQPRMPEPMVSVGGDSIDITSTHWGPHHGPQAAILAGTGGYEISGSLPYSNSPHTAMVTEGCPTCHMSSVARGNEAGGHTMSMEYDDHGTPADWTEGCTACHGSLADFDHNGVQTEITGLLSQLETALQGEGILDAAGEIVEGRWSSIQAGALLNYLIVEQDGSQGVHNSDYCRALLQNALENL